MEYNRVVLVQPPIQDFYLTKKRTIPYGLASIASHLIDNHFDVTIIDGLATPKSRTMDYPLPFSHVKPFFEKKDLSAFSLFHEFRHFGYSYEHLGNLVRQQAPAVVGISSLFTAYADQAMETAQTIKRFHPCCRIVMGGHHPTVFPKETLESPAVDFVLRGEGEFSMTALCNALKGEKDLKKVAGLCFKDGGAVHISDPVWVADLSTLPVPASHLVNHTFYSRNKRASVSVVCSRGCPMNCSYCSVSATSSHGRYRQRPVEAVAAEIQTLVREKAIGFIDFEDENLCLDKAWFHSLFDRLTPVLKDRNIELRAMNGLYPPSIDEPVIQTMKASGFKTLNLALGSTDPAQLNRFKRKNVISAFENALKLARKYDLDAVSYIIGAAPGQSATQSLNDLLYLAQKRTLIGFSVFYPAPGSLDYQRCADQGLLPDRFNQMRSTAFPIDDTTTRIEAVTLLRLARIINFIKSLIDSKEEIPAPRPFPGDRKGVGKNLSGLVKDRRDQSKQLLQWFLHDGVIRGVGPGGTVYDHTVDFRLTQRFLHALSHCRIAGIKHPGKPADG
ncbi:MAG: B12-binding domain-containing radical SAM protein [Desulfobacterales bacterium]|nr:B12-binding domain-containing radical SAM protein [Desulfobacterales bacterium]